MEATTEDQDQVCFARGGVLLLGAGRLEMLGSWVWVNTKATRNWTAGLVVVSMYRASHFGVTLFLTHPHKEGLNWLRNLLFGHLVAPKLGKLKP